MKRIFIAIIVCLSILLFASCTQKPVACTMDAKVCPDGSAVGRIGPDCEFAPCPDSDTSSCDYADETKKYVGKSNEECSRIKFICETGREYFSDECGCGCETAQDNPSPEKNYCDVNNRPEACTLEYTPVCGWFTENIKCIKYPCASTFGNGCQACASENVAYWTAGECPQ